MKKALLPCLRILKVYRHYYYSYCSILDREGNTRRTYNATAHILDVGNGRFVSTKSEDVNDSPVTAARSAIQQVLEEPLRQPLLASQDRPWADPAVLTTPSSDAWFAQR